MMQQIDKSFETSKECDDDEILLKENETLKLEIHALKQIIQNQKVDRNNTPNHDQKEDLFKVMDDLIKENEGIAHALKTFTHEETKNIDTLNTRSESPTSKQHTNVISSPNSKNALPTIMETNIMMMEETTTTTTSPCRPLKLFQEDTIMERHIQKGNNDATYVRTLQEEVNRLTNEITVLREEETSQTHTLQIEIQRLNKELTDTKLLHRRRNKDHSNNDDNDDSNMDINSSTQRRKQFHQIERLVESFMEKDIEIQGLKREMKSLHQKLQQSERKSHFILDQSNNDMENETDVNILVRFLRRNSNNSMRASHSSSIQDHSSYKSMYEELKPINEDIRKDLERFTKEYNLTKFKLKEEQERSTNDLKKFAIALHGVDELRTAVEEMSRELKRKGGMSSADPSIFEKLQRSYHHHTTNENDNNMDMTPKKDGVNNNIWAGIMKARRLSVPPKENRIKRKDKGRRKPELSDDSSIVTSAF